MKAPKQTKCAQCPLKKLDVFRAVSPQELEFIQDFKKGEFVTEVGATILSEGTSGPHLFTVLSGWAFRYKMLSDGRRQILNFVLPGDFIGLQSSMLNEMQHSVEALTDMVLCVFPRDQIWRLYSHHPSLAFDLTWLAARSERLLDENLLSIGRRSAGERVSFVLLDMFRRCEQLSLTSGAKAEFPFTQLHLADALGLSLVHTNKTLKKLSAKRLFKWKNGIFEILDADKLTLEANMDVAGPQLRPLI